MTTSKKQYKILLGILKEIYCKTQSVNTINKNAFHNDQKHCSHFLTEQYQYLHVPHLSIAKILHLVTYDKFLCEGEHVKNDYNCFSCIHQNNK